MNAPLVVVKLGSSVLRDETHLFVAVDEIYAHVRRGWQVVAVTSAFAGETDRLDGRARAINGTPDAAAYAYLLGAGEAESAALLTLATDRAGIPATLLTPAQLGLRTRGGILDSVPHRLSASVIRRALETSVVVVPGFLGLDAGGRPTLLGRGGSDLTALFLADRLDADECLLVKSVDGWCDGRPASGRRYRTLRWDDAESRPARVVQPKAVRYARGARRSFRVAAPASSGGTHVGSGPTALELLPPNRPPTSVALLGLGTVGWGVYEHLRARPNEFRVVAALVRDSSRPRPGRLPPGLLTECAETLPRDPDVLVVEALGGVQPAGDHVAAALRRGQSVVTANKDLLASRGPELRRLAAAGGCHLLDSATVGGACPMLETVRRLAVDGPGIVGLRGVLNGTCNWILERLAGGVEWSDAVRLAVEIGLAEADPKEDVSGRDAARKLALLGRAAFGGELTLADIAVEGIGPHVRVDPERPVRLVASIRRASAATAVGDARGARRRIEAVVRPEALDPADPLVRVRDEWNMLVVTLADGRETIVRGRGAGRWPTATAVIADLLGLRSRRVAREMVA